MVYSKKTRNCSITRRHFHVICTHSIIAITSICILHLSNNTLQPIAERDSPSLPPSLHPSLPFSIPPSSLALPLPPQYLHKYSVSYKTHIWRLLNLRVLRKHYYLKSLFLSYLLYWSVLNSIKLPCPVFIQCIQCMFAPYVITVTIVWPPSRYIVF